MRKTSITLIFVGLLWIMSNGQSIVSVTKIESLTKQEVSAQLGVVQARNGVDVYHVIYNTIDPHNSPVMASGALLVPTGASCSSFPLVSYQHGTTLNKENVPSRGNDPGSIVSAAFGYVTAAPDFLGLGDSPGLHPYMHAESEATAAIDLMRAARTFISDSLTIQLNGEVLLTGYSQGGHATMAVHKYIEDNNLLSEFNVIVSVPLSGPYNMSGVQATIAADSIYSVPGYYPYLIESYQSIYGNIYNSPSDVYKSPYDVSIYPFLDGTHNIGDLNNALSPNIYHFLQDSFVQSFIADTLSVSNPLKIALKLNDNHDWTPTRPVRMVYCDGDEEVFYQNALVALAAMQANGATDVQAYHALPGGTHGGCAVLAFLYTVSSFDTLSSVCFPVGTETAVYTDEISVYPNPTDNQITIDMNKISTIKPLQLEFFSLDGKLLLTEIVSVNQHQISVGKYGKGMYILRLVNEDIQIRKKVVVH